MRLVSDSTVGLSDIMAKFIALVLTDVLLSIGLLTEAVGSNAWADTESSNVLVMSHVPDFSIPLCFDAFCLLEYSDDMTKSFLRQVKKK